MGRGRKYNHKGRSTGTQPFLMLPQWVFSCAAYRSLKPGPRALLWEIIARFNGANNGRIGFSQRDMSSAINVADRETVAAYARELSDKGFIWPVKRGGFNVKAADRRASEWALTWLKVGEELPTKEFASWKPSNSDGTEKPASKDGKSVPEIIEPIVERANVRGFPSQRSLKTAA